ncbi:AAA family ATPase [Phaeobacter gallaeciensis]|uniref:AAA family ATPase n=1 Tax=Phaeobacter gallaeciensis TaxID=60890 RepID=UPI00237FCC7E|nr:AAA family ATPase [Phaeobacter gallaeciensis]MDE4062609.1 AAA family ATPase [Phaeobacter gallaeciensis]MDE4125487.1 AAA family ATPase [Phaeobacter gallaeciensis]MDE4130055.1 AAA family ATPase [Phaeobacter gallaeciensis]
MTQPSTSFSTPPATIPVTDTPDWTVLAARLRHSLISQAASWAITAYMASEPAGENDAEAPAATPAGVSGEEKAEADAGRTTPLADAARSSAHSDSWDIDDLLDQIEAEADVAMGAFADALPPVPEEATAPRKMYRLRPEAALAVVRVAKTFGSAEAMVRALGAPGAVTLITTADPALDEHVIRLIEHLAQPHTLWPRGAAIPVVLTAEKAWSTKPGASEPAVAALSGSLRLALDTRRPAVVIAPAARTAPKTLKVLQPETIALAPLDRGILTQLLVDAYPEAEKPGTALSALPTDAPVARLTHGDLLLALRWPDPKRAVTTLAAALAPEETQTGPGLAAFPLPDEVRAPLEQLVEDLRAWKAGEIPWRDVSRGLLLAGPPGTGKTELARLVAREAGIEVIAGSVATWQARGERASGLVRAMADDFAKAASLAPCVIFIDELDAVGSRDRRDHNASWTEYVVGAFLEALDGYAGQEGVVAMAATNHVERVDPALRRPGRFDRILTLRHPTPDQMPQVLRWQMWPDLQDADLTAVAAQAMGMSGADVAGLVRAARATARRARRPLSVKDLSAALNELRPPMGDALRWQVAVHEAGHAVVGVATGIAKPRLLALQGDGGVTHAERHVIHQRRAELEAALAVDMAGRAAELLVFGQVSAGAGGGADSDLARATAMAVAMEAAWGLGDRLTWCGDPETIAPRLRLDPPLAARVEDHLRRAEDRALRIMQAQRPVLEEIATALCDKGMLTGPALDELMAQVRPEPAQPTQGERAQEIPTEADRTRLEGERDAERSAPYQPLDRAS